jgi:general secretion pathway protein C
MNADGACGAHAGSLRTAHCGAGPRAAHCNVMQLKGCGPIAIFTLVRTMAPMNALQVRLLSFALFAVFCATLTYWVVTLTTRAAPPLQAAAVRSPAAPEDAATLFGGQLTHDANRSIRLFGILALSQGASAIIGAGDEPPRAVPLGGAIAQGVKLDEVKARSIIVDRNGARSEIFLPANPAGPTIYVR